MFPRFHFIFILSLVCYFGILFLFLHQKGIVMATLQVSNTQVSTLDALWALFKSQPKAVRKAFVKRLKSEETSEELKEDVVKHIKAVRSGKEKTYSFDSLEDAKKWLDE